MSVSEILDGLIRGDLPRSVEVFGPEILLCATVIVLLLIRLFSLDRTVPPYVVALFGSLIGFVGVLAQFVFYTTSGGAAGGGPLGMGDSLFGLFLLSPEGAGTAGGIFTGLLMHDAFTLFFRLGLTFFLVLVVALTVLSGIPDNEDGPDFYTLLIGSTVGRPARPGPRSDIDLRLVFPPGPGGWRNGCHGATTGCWRANAPKASLRGRSLMPDAL